MIEQKRAQQRKPSGQSTLAWVMVLSLLGCGGGGGGGDTVSLPTTDAMRNPTASSPLIAPSASETASVAPSIPPVAESAGKLLISEIATNYYSNDVAWLEIYNTSAAPVTLSDYTLNSSYINADTGIPSFVPMSFKLPDVAVPAHGFMIIAGKTSVQLQNGPAMVYVRNGNAVPFWNGSGSVELQRDGVTVDAVRFGTSIALLGTAGAWSGVNVAALPSGADEHGKSIVRLAAAAMADTHTANDWTLVNFATPGGPNDVLPNVIDSDLDGIPDSAKVPGGSYAGLDLYAMGARRGQRDIFLEIDYMASSDSATTPRREALEKMQKAFAANGIALHMDVGGLYGESFSPAQFHLGGGNAIPFSPCIELDTSSVGAGARDGCASFQSYKNAHFDVRRRFIFHYAVFAHSLNSNGSAGPSGTAELFGNDLIVTLGGYGFSDASEVGRNMLINMQASALMHEFGHNLGLKHGGNEDVNYKPNHYSIMNYLYQFTGLSATPNSLHAADRYYLAYGLKGLSYCGLEENSPCTDRFLMNYSDGTGAVLDENNLSEAHNIGRGSIDGAYADWDNNNALTTTSFGNNINPLDGYGRSVLKDYNEWGNLVLPFSRGFSGSSSGKSLSTRPVPRINPMNPLIGQPRIEELPLPAQLHQTIRQARGG